jgi:hypothetical protein
MTLRTSISASVINPRVHGTGWGPVTCSNEARVASRSDRASVVAPCNKAVDPTNAAAGERYATTYLGSPTTSRVPAPQNSPARAASCSKASRTAVLSLSAER